MNTWRITLTLLLAVGSTSTARAQIGTFVRPQINPRPTVSPYLSIFRGQSGAVNYYNIVRPQIEMGRQMQMLQSEVHGLQGAPAVSPLPGTIPVEQQPFASMSTTGHPVSFMNPSHYFSGRPGGTGSGVAGGTGNPLGYPNPAVPLRLPLATGSN
jgi:hypothetical protein